MPIRSVRIIAFAFALLGCLSPLMARADAAADPTAIPSGTYTLDPAHSSIIFRVMDMGFSYFTGRFDRFDAKLNYDGSNPENSNLSVTIAPASIDCNNPGLENQLRQERFLNVMTYPTITFASTGVQSTGPATGAISGNMTMLGQTVPITINAALVGAGQNPVDKAQVIGVTANGTFKRSLFGFNAFLPMIGDDVSYEINAEFDKSP